MKSRRVRRIRPSPRCRRSCIYSLAYFVRLHTAKLHGNAIPTDQRFKPHTELQRRVNVAATATLHVRVWPKTLLRRLRGHLRGYTNNHIDIINLTQTMSLVRNCAIVEAVIAKACYTLYNINQHTITLITAHF